MIEFVSLKALPGYADRYVLTVKQRRFLRRPKLRIFIGPDRAHGWLELPNYAKANNTLDVVLDRMLEGRKWIGKVEPLKGLLEGMGA